MKNIIVVTPTSVNNDILRELVDSLGGYWNEEASLNQGVIERGDATIYLSSWQDLNRDYDSHEIAALTAILGREPKALIDIHIGHSSGSTELAEEAANTIIERWDGYLDDNIQEIEPPTCTKQCPTLGEKNSGG